MHCNHSRIRTCTLLCVLSSIDDSQLTKGHPDVDDQASSPPAKKPKTSSHPDTSGGMCALRCNCSSISEAMIWFHDRLLMCLWTCKGTGFYFIEEPVHSLFDRTLSHAEMETSGSCLHYLGDI